MPKISDTWKPGFSAVAAGKAFATGNYADGALNLFLALGQSGYAIGKNYLPKSKGLDLLSGNWGSEESLRDAFGVEAVILERGIQIVTALTLLLGSGKEQGQTYESASKDFDLAWQNLKDAAVDSESWSGASADAYNARNAEQMQWASTAADLDLQVAALLLQNSDMLGNCKITLTSVRAFFTVCIPIAATLRWAAGPAGPAISRWFQWAAFGIGMAVALPTTGLAALKAGQNANQLQLVNVEYAGIAASAVVTGSESTTPQVAPAPKSSVSGFDQINAGSSTAVSGGFDEGASQSARRPSPGAANSGEGESPQGVWAGESSERAVPQTGAAPAYAMPAVGQVPGRQSGSRAGSGSAASSEKSTARETPAVEDDVLTPDLETAATGAGAGERAPVDTTARGAEQAQERVR
ncbi:EspA/EspE family type VII secretion system effector [Mycobacterium sp. 050272]|uniref:EspA/EspE family type VII secretion system effector n=1 Tax=Mycobacterium sp. 050272 TaxID=3142488 RepID=UPI00319150A5